MISPCDCRSNGSLQCNALYNYTFRKNFVLIALSLSLSLSLEWYTDGWAAAVEEQSRQAFLRDRGLHDLFLCHPRLPLLPAQDDLSHVQKKVPLGMSGKWNSEFVFLPLRTTVTQQAFLAPT